MAAGTLAVVREPLIEVRVRVHDVRGLDDLGVATVSAPVEAGGVLAFESGQRLPRRALASRAPIGFVPGMSLENVKDAPNGAPFMVAGRSVESVVSSRSTSPWSRSARRLCGMPNRPSCT
jgi:hypothetical protein